MSLWQRWLQHPESLWARKAFFHLHLWVGVGVGLYIILMSFSGSVIVYRNELDNTFLVSTVEWLVDLHANLLSGKVGRFGNGIGSICLTSLCLTGIVIWWPGISHWHRALSVNWRSHLARLTWDLHGSLGFWCVFFVLTWGISGFYLSFPRPVNALFGFLDSGDKFTDRTLYWLTLIHFGRFGWFAQMLWSLVGLVLAVLSVTGIFVCCHRMIYGSHHNHGNNPE
jgi:uncharacterized iron-regulated membrane protein